MGTGDRLRRLDDRWVGTPRRAPARRHLLLALLAGLVAAGVPAAYVLAAGGPLLVAALLPLLALVPVGVVLVTGAADASTAPDETGADCA